MNTARLQQSLPFLYSFPLNLSLVLHQTHPYPMLPIFLSDCLHSFHVKSGYVKPGKIRYPVLCSESFIPPLTFWRNSPNHLHKQPFFSPWLKTHKYSQKAKHSFSEATKYHQKKKKKKKVFVHFLVWLYLSVLSLNCLYAIPAFYKYFHLVRYSYPSTCCSQRTKTRYSYPSALPSCL